MKRCACVFICLSTGAIHLEMVYSLNTDSCLSAITHFIATPIDNNVTNFVGAVILGNHRGKLVTYIVWKFNLAAAPHFGGSLERMLKTCKQAAIYYVLKGQCHTDELLAIILCLTEELLNARPLTSISNDPTDLEALTPNQFLGRPSIAIPHLPDAQKFPNHRRMFCVAQAHMDNMWSIWLKLCFAVHNIRQKWYKERPQLKENYLVLILDDREKRVFTALEKCHFENDGNIRSCDILTQSVVFRPTVILSRLFDNIWCFLLLPKRNTGPAMKKLESPYRKNSSNWVI